MEKRRRITLKGDPSLIKSECSLRTIEKAWQSGDQGFLLELQNYEVEWEEEYETKSELKGDDEGLPMVQQLLNQYTYIFRLPIGLPPKRTVDHRILTLPDHTNQCSTI